jgi:hypothetical protein
LEFTPAFERSLNEHIEKDKKDRESKAAKNATKTLHAYKLEDYGLDKATVESRFREYIDKYCSPSKGN